MKPIHIQYYKTKIGEFVMGSFDGNLCLMDFRYRKMRTTVDNRIKKELRAEFSIEDDEILKKTRQQLDEYLDGNRKQFDLPLLMAGTDFQKQVWKSLMEIPYGATSTYLQQSKYIDREKAFRAVARANGANAISIIIPCHRIIGSRGELVGYGGGMFIKKRLLILEKRHSTLHLEGKNNFFMEGRYTGYDSPLFMPPHPENSPTNEMPTNKKT